MFIGVIPQVNGDTRLVTPRQVNMEKTSNPKAFYKEISRANGINAYLTFVNRTQTHQESKTNVRLEKLFSSKKKKEKKERSLRNVLKC